MQLRLTEEAKKYLNKRGREFTINTKLVGGG